MTAPDNTLSFNDTELTMLGKTADALSAYMGTAILAEVGQTEGGQWVIFARALDEQETVGEDIVHVQVGGPGTHVLGQRGGLDTDTTAYDCAFMWAIEITDDEDERFIRLNPQGEVFDTSPQLAPLLPLSLEEPELPTDLDSELELDAHNPNLTDDADLDRLDEIDHLDDLDPNRATRH
jgi:hypothetical protein